MANAPKNIVDLTQEIVDYTKEKFWDKSSQKVAGAYNLCPNNAVSQVKNTVTFTVNDDLSITANGTPNAGTSLPISTTTLPTGKYKVIATPDGSTTHYMTVAWQGTTIARSYSGNDVFILSQPTLVSMELWIPTGDPLSNVIIKPMITQDLNATYDDYVPYAPTNAECAQKTDLTSIIATGSTNETGAAIAAGTYFYLNGTLCRAKLNIATGATFTLDTNYEVVTVGDAIKNLIKAPLYAPFTGTVPANGSQSFYATFSSIPDGYWCAGVLGVQFNVAGLVLSEYVRWSDTSIRITAYNLTSADISITDGKAYGFVLHK